MDTVFVKPRRVLVAGILGGLAALAWRIAAGRESAWAPAGLEAGPEQTDRHPASAPPGRAAGPPVPPAPGEPAPAAGR
ncbi:MAG: hypothetical protein MUC89_07315 [Acetobacteraceae bacterium]|jgi:hypothetical protein|nr:hypothetical protein [Acetobacteraceae bacterium]